MIIPVGPQNDDQVRLSCPTFSFREVKKVETELISVYCYKRSYRARIEDQVRSRRLSRE